MTRKKLIARLDKVFSQWVRSKDADHRGFVQCFTCGVWKHWKTVDAGHFQSRAKFSTRWDEMNVKCQCKSLQRIPQRGAVPVRPAPGQGHGEGTAMELEQLSNTTKKFSSEELEALIDVYNRRLRKL